MGGWVTQDDVGDTFMVVRTGGSTGVGSGRVEIQQSENIIGRESQVAEHQALHSRLHLKETT